MPITFEQMNSTRASPTPSFGRAAKLKARSGLATFIMIFMPTSGMFPSSTRFTRNGTGPAYTKPVSPSAQDTVTVCPLLSSRVAFPLPTTAGMPSSRAMIAAWQVRPPRLVTMALARFMTGSQSGSVMSATSTSPSCT